MSGLGLKAQNLVSALGQLLQVMKLLEQDMLQVKKNSQQKLYLSNTLKHVNLSLSLLNFVSHHYNVST